jgi:hypothetical protein
LGREPTAERSSSTLLKTLRGGCQAGPDDVVGTSLSAPGSNSNNSEPMAEPGMGDVAAEAAAPPDRGAGRGYAATASGLGAAHRGLGRGSWAAAYRQASGQRREAFQLLSTCGIVTARELADDLTVISQEHIEECVLIALGMLQSRPLERWEREAREAQLFFEARLTLLYQQR